VDAGQRGIQLVRMDGQRMQTLYCGSDFGWMQWSPDNKYVAFVDPGTPPWQDPSKQTFKLLNTTTGTIQTKARDSSHLLPFPQAWLDPTHLLVVQSGLPGEESNKLSLLDITTWTIKPILDLSTLVNQCMDATFSIDGTHLFLSRAASCKGNEHTFASYGPSSIEVQAVTGGPAKTIFRTPYGILSLRVATSTSMLLIVYDGVTLTDPNGVWKMNSDGTGLTKLTSAAAIIKDPANEEINFAGNFGWNTDLPWSNVSRDGAYYTIQVNSRADNALTRLLIGSMNGGTPVTIASGPVETPIGWTTM